MYGRADDGAAGPAQLGLAEINVPILPERSGQLLRQALQERFERVSGVVERRYDLVVSYALAGDAIGYQQDSSVTRVRVTGNATWSLHAQDAQRSTLVSGTARNVDGYNIQDQQYFASDLTSDVVYRRVAGAVADQIALQLGAYFNKRATAAN